MQSTMVESISAAIAISNCNCYYLAIFSICITFLIVAVFLLSIKGQVSTIPSKSSDLLHPQQAGSEDLTWKVCLGMDEDFQCTDVAINHSIPGHQVAYLGAIYLLVDSFLVCNITIGLGYHVHLRSYTAER